MNELMISNIAHTVGRMNGTMSSLEIARLTGKEHRNVLRDIREFLDEIDEGDRLRFEQTYKDAYGRDQQCFVLPKRECLGLASKYDAKLRMAIIDRWAELEYKEKSGEYFDPEKVAHDRFEYITGKACSVADLLGYSEGHKRKEALEIAVKVEQDTGISVMPSFLANDPQAVNPDTTLSPYHGTHAALVAKGTTGATVSTIAKSYPFVSPTDINNILCGGGYQTRIKAGQYAPTEKGKLLCNQRTFAYGKDIGRVVITNWLYDDNKILRDFIADGVRRLSEARTQNQQLKAQNSKKNMTH